MTKIDLHMHSNVTDGKFSAKELVDLALSKDIKAIALTDHDNASGCKEAAIYAKEKGLEFVSGIEITITPPEDIKEIHMTGLFIDPENDQIKNIPIRHRKYREAVVKKIINKLQDLGYDINFEELLRESPRNHFGRPSIAKILLRKYPSEFKNTKEIFDRLLGKEGKAFVTARGTSMKQAIKIIHESGGLAFIAHPWFLGKHMEKVIEMFKALGGDGIEREYDPSLCVDQDMSQRLDHVIKKYGLLVSGGTDFHNDTDNSMGKFGLTEQEFNRLKEKVADKVLK